LNPGLRADRVDLEEGSVDFEYCRNCGALIKPGRKKFCGDGCREEWKKKSTGSVSARHACLLRILKKEKCSESDPLFDIDYYEQILADQKCFFCHGDLSPSGHALDRRDNSKGHTAANVLEGPICGDCNGIRSNRLSVEHMQRLSPILIEIRIELEDDRKYRNGEINHAELQHRKDARKPRN
jgi:hypothetical protein